jgi:dihydroxyacetone kinase
MQVQLNCINLAVQDFLQVALQGRPRCARSRVGNFVTSLDMAGCSVKVSMLDGEMKRLWDAPVHIPALRWAL